MRIGVLGTGAVGRTIGTELVELGHEVRMGSRAAGNEAAVEWASSVGQRADEGDFAAAAEVGEVVFNCTAGAASLEALEQAGSANLAGKLLVDVANPLDFSGGMPPALTIANTESLGERIQATYQDVRVVKALNTMNCEVMVDPSRVPGEHVAFVCGEDEAAKHQVTDLLGDFGWPRERVLDLGGIAAARATEMYLPLWVLLMQHLGTSGFNIALERRASG